MMILKIEFDETVWAKIIDMLATQPYKDAGPVIAAIAQQFQEQRNPGDDGKVAPLRRDASG
jgi:hypothetical protein